MGNVICFYLGKPCRYGSDAPPEEQMDCPQCPAYVVWKDLMDLKMRKSVPDCISKDPEENKESDQPEEN